MNYSLITGFHEILLPIRVAELWSFFFIFGGFYYQLFFLEMLSRLFSGIFTTDL